MPPARSPKLLATCALVVALSALSPASAQTSVPELSDDEKDALIQDLQSQVIDLDGKFDQVMTLLQGMQAEMAGLRGLGSGVPGDEFYIPRFPNQAAAGMPEGFAGVYDKPFIRDGSKVHLGGYIDVEFTDPQSDGGDKFFDQHRLVPFLYADVSDRVKVSTEVEIEHGSELEVEFAQIDYLFNDHFNARAGIQLLPLGKFNEVHDSPLQDLTARPLVDRYIIPTTLRDVGVGAWGDITEEVSYQVAITNGFKGMDADGNSVITDTKGLRNAAPQKEALGFDEFENINDDLATSGRVAWQPELGMEFGVSALFDTYDERGDNDMQIFAVDTTLNGQAVDFLPDNLEILGEAAWVNLDTDALADAADVPNGMHGYYIQGNWHFTPDFIDSWVDDGWVADGAHFTFVLRQGGVDIGHYSTDRTTVGLNFRPNESNTVFKMDYQFNRESGGDGGNDDNAFLFSAATYF